jgi:hypothetical protein
MNQSDYMRNMQKLLLMVRELHLRGYQDIRVIPSLSPSGLSCRCSLLFDADAEIQEFIGSSWIFSLLDRDGDSKLSVEGLADLFIEENREKLDRCRKDNKEYVEWYAGMLKQLEEEELPYAYGEYFSPSDYWETTDGKRISTLPNEKRYYTNY